MEIYIIVLFLITLPISFYLGFEYRRYEILERALEDMAPNVEFKWLKQVQLGLWIVIFGLSWWLAAIIITPIKFEKDKKHRYELVKQNLIDIRKAQVAFKDVHGRFSNTFNELIKFVKTGEFTIVQRRDSSFKYIPKHYDPVTGTYYDGNPTLKDSLLFDTLGTASVRDSLFPGIIDLRFLEKVPLSDNEKFQMSAGKIKKSGLEVYVFEAFATNKQIFPYLKSDNHSVKRSERLQVGSMQEATLNGNWQ